MKKVYQLKLTAEHPVIRGHQVHGQTLLPGLAYIDMLYQIARDVMQLDFRKYCLKRLSISNPLIVSEDRPVNLRITFEEISDYWAIAVEGIETDRQGNGAAEKSYITAELHREEILFTEELDIESVKRTADRRVDLETIYAEAVKHGLLHQGMIKAKGDIYLMDSGGVAEVRVDGSYLGGAEDYLFHPALMDGAAMSTVALENKGAAGGDRDLYLPLFYEWFFCREPIKTCCYAVVKESSCRRVNDIKSMDILFFNTKGKQVAQLKGLTAKRIRFKGQINPNMEDIPDLSHLQGDRTGRIEEIRLRDNSDKGNKTKVLPVEIILRKIFSRYTNLEYNKIDLETGFFDLGMESSQLLALVKDIENAFCLALNPTLLFEYSNLKELTAYIENKMEGMGNCQLSGPGEKRETKADVYIDSIGQKNENYKFYRKESYLKDHLVFGKPALMGITHPSLMLETYLKSHSDAYPLELKNIRFIGGPVTLEENEIAHIMVQPDEDGSGAGFKTVYYTEAPENAKPCCKVDYIKTVNLSSRAMDIEAILKSAKPAEVDVLDRLYNANESFILGSMLQTLESVYTYNESILIGKVNLTGKLKKGDISRFVLDPLLLNSCYILNNAAGIQKNTNIFIPLMIENLTVFRPMMETAYIIKTIRCQKSDFVSFDALMLTEEGEIIAEMINASVKEVQNPSLLSNASFEKALPKSASAVSRPGYTKPQPMDIAIIGLSGRYPQSYDISALWGNLSEGKDCIVEIPGDRWDWREYYSEDRTKPGYTYSKWGGFIEDMDRFDPLFFNISPREAELMDPQERLFMEHCWVAMEDAGYTRERLRNTETADFPRKVGIYAGAMHQEYALYAAESSMKGQRIGLGGGASSIATRVSYFCDFHGPSMAVDTMCSSSLTAIWMACEALRQNLVDAAFAGGVNLTIHPNKYLMLSQGQFISSKGRCESFGEGGDGYIPGEGVGVLLLKRLADAERDRDHIYAVIKGAGINHAGRAGGYTVPNPKAQSRAISMALEQSGIDPRTISYIEAHGTGTKLGDPVEIEGLTRVFGSKTDDKQFCRIGSIKSNIGHCEAAAGVAGVTKVILQMRYGKIVPSLHSKVLNPNIDFSNTPFIVNQELRDWERPVVDGKEQPRRAGVSSFGAGGVNTHLVIEEYLPENRKQACGMVKAHIPAFIVLSAKSEEQVKRQVRNLLTMIGTQELKDEDLADMAYTLQVGREAMVVRIALAVGSIQELKENLECYLEGKDSEGLYNGRVKRNKETIGIFTEDEDMQKTVNSWISKGKYGKILNLWVNGYDFDWEKLYTDEKPCRISLPTYPFERKRYWLPLAENKPAERSLPDYSPMTDSGREEHPAARTVRLLKKQWEPCPASSNKSLSGNIAILTTEETEELAVQLAGLYGGMQVLYINDLKTRLQQPEYHGKAYDGCIDLVGCGRDKPDCEDWIPWLQRLIEHSRKETLTLLCVTEGLESLQNASVNLSGASRAGLYRMLQSEYSFLCSRHMDVEASIDPKKLVELIISEFTADSEDIEICYRDGKRYRAFLGELGLEDWSREPDTTFPDNHVLWITGGTRGLGYLCAKHFAEHYGVRKMVLTGREEMPPKEQWKALGMQNTPAAQKIRRIQELESLGVEVKVLSVPLLDSCRVQQEVDEVKRSMGPVGGIIHCAGIGDAENPAFIRKPLMSVRKVLEPKIDGLDVLYQVFAEESLKFFVMFSSVSSVIPTLASGQSDYAMANAYMDYFAAAKGNDCPIVSIQWPSWKDTGMGEIKSKAYEQTGLLSMTDEEGLMLLDNILENKIGPVILPAVVNRDLWKPHQLMERRINASFSYDIQSEKAATIDASNADDAIETKTQNWLIDLFSKEFKIEPSELEIDRAFQDYGMDSILLAQILRSINKSLKEQIDPSILYEYSTIELLAKWIISNYAPKLLEIFDSANSKSCTLQTKDSSQPPISPISSGGREVQRESCIYKGTSQQDIAVIGLSCRFPGADNLGEYWKLLYEGGQTIDLVPRERWGHSDNFYAGLIDSNLDFDPKFFLIPEEDVRAMDPQALVVLKESLKLWYHAGYSHQEIKGKAVGVYIGGRSQYRPDKYSIEQTRNPVMALGQNYLAANISQFFDLRGPSVVVDTACSSVLVGMSMAIQALRSADIEAAVVGGVNIFNSDEIHRIFQQRKILSPEGIFHVFDQRASGVVLGEGAGMVLLKTLDKALEDGDRIYAVIKALAVNNDGRTAGPATPNLLAQKEVMQAALMKSGKKAEEISYIEVNGSGSEVTDLLELKAIQSVYGSSGTSRLGLGSVKPNIGHPLCAEGIASFIKVVLMLQNRGFVPFLSGEQPMTHFNMESTRFYFSRKPEQWANTPRIAGINCFADGGTNAHIILEEWEEKEFRPLIRQSIPLPELNRYDVHYSKVLNSSPDNGKNSRDVLKKNNNKGEYPLFDKYGKKSNNASNVWRRKLEEEG